VYGLLKITTVEIVDYEVYGCEV